ncbi:MAG: PAS domain S-box protein [bacterium]
MLVRQKEFELLNALFEDSPDHIYFKDAKSRFIKMNRASARKLGLNDPSEAIGKTDYDYFTEEHALQAFLDEQKILRTGESIVGIIEKETWPDKSTTWVTTTKIPLKNSDGEIVGIMGISRDMTELKKLEDEIEIKKVNLESLITQRTSELVEINKKLVKEIIERRRAEENYKNLVNNLELGILIFQDRLVKYVNPAIEKLLDYTLDDFNSLELSTELLSPDDLLILRRENYEQLHSRENPCAYEKDFITKKEFKKRLRIASIYSEYKGLPAMQVSILDLTNLNAPSENFTTGDEKVELLLGNSKDIITVYNPDGGVKEIFIPENYDVDKSEIIGKKSNEFLSDKEAAKVLSQVKEVFTTGKSIWVENAYEWKNNSYWFTEQLSPRRDSGGNVTSVVRFSRDITEKKKHEIELQKAKETAEAANIAKSEFLTNMSHELKTPLNGILGYAQLLKKEENLTVAMEEGLKIIERSGSYLLNLINDVLDFSKIEARQLELFNTVFSLPELLSSIIEIVRFKSEEKNLLLQLNLSHDIPKIVKADDKRISQVLYNLLSNGLKFTEKGSVKLNVIRKGNKVRFSVEDTGFGIPENMREDIFQPFRFIDNRARRLGGSGLGLAICRRLVTLMGGELMLESVMGEGSKFWFDIEMHEVLDFIPAEIRVREKIIGYKGRKRKVLIIDDIQENLFLLASILSNAGFETIEAMSGEEGIKKSIEHDPDLILMDLIMPEVDGFETIKAIRSNSRTGKIKIIAVSASALNSARNKSIESGANDFIAKPINTDELFEKVGECLNLEWEFKKIGNKVDDSVSRPEIIVPPTDLLRILYKIAKRGDLVALDFELKKLLNKDKSYKAFVDEIKIYSDKFKVKQIRDIFERYLGEE